MQTNQTAATDEPALEPPSAPAPDDPAADRLRRLEHMFRPFADDGLMRELRRLAAKCAREGLIRG